MTRGTAPMGAPDRRLVLLPVLERGAQITGLERDRIGVDIARAVRGGESCSSVARRMNRSKQWATDMVAQYDPSALPVNLRGDHRPIMVRLIAKEYRAGASVHALTSRWRLVRPTVIRLLAEAAIDARTRIPRPSREWRVANLPPEVLPADLDAAPTDEEWVYICAYLTVRREARATIRSLVDETGLSYSTVYRRLTALRVQPDQTCATRPDATTHARNFQGMAWPKKLTAAQQQKAAKADAKKHMKEEGIETNPACKHPGTRGSSGPRWDENGKSYVQYWCLECSVNTGRYYYPD